MIMIFIMSTIIMDVHKKQNFIVSVYTSARWVQPAKPIFLTPTLLMGSLPGDAGRAG